MNLFTKLRNSLTKTRANLVGRIDHLLRGRGRLDTKSLEELEEALIEADVGVKATLELIEALKDRIREAVGQDLASILAEEVTHLLKGTSAPLNMAATGPTVIMVVGVNGTGKTTTVGKLAARFRNEGRKVLVAACDTFRAAATEQLEVWAERARVEIIKHDLGGDPAAVAYDAISAARSRKMDVLLIDTAGRLHTKVNLMEELKKIRRVVARGLEGAPHEVLLVLDATGGQNALSQARVFTEAVEVTGLVLTKLDGSAKGGAVIGIARELGIPVKLIGIGEAIEDLRDFDPEEFVAALFSPIDKESEIV